MEENSEVDNRNGQTPDHSTNHVYVVMNTTNNNNNNNSGMTDEDVSTVQKMSRSVEDSRRASIMDMEMDKDFKSTATTDSFGDIGEKTRRMMTKHSLLTKTKSTSGTGSTRSIPKARRADKGASSEVVASFGAGAIVTFSWYIFFRELFYHMFGPLSIPFILFLGDGYTGLKNRRFHMSLNAQFLSQTFSWCLVVLLNVLYVLHIGNTDDTVVDIEELVQVDMLFCARSVVIACKYGYLSPQELADIGTRDLSDEELMDRLLVSWLRPNMVKIVQEIEYAAARTGLHMCSLSMFAHFQPIHYSSKRRLDDLVSKLNREFHYVDDYIASVPHKDVIMERWRYGLSKGFLNTRLFLLHVVKKSVERTSKLTVYGLPILGAIFLWSLTVSLVPIWYRWASNEPAVGREWFEIVFSVCYVVLSTYLGGTILIYFWVAFNDIRRRLFMMRMLTGSLECGRGCTKRNRTGYWALPALDYYDAETVYYWSGIRRLIKDLGAQFYARIQAYTSFFLLCCIGFVIWLGFAVFTNIVSGSAGVVVMLIDILVLFTLVGCMARMAQRINRAHKEQVALLSRHQLDVIRAFTVDVDCDDINSYVVTKWKRARHMMQSTIELIESDDTISPIRIMGFDANLRFFRFLLTFGVAGLALAIRALQLQMRD